MSQIGTVPTQIRATGGGARSDFWRQLLADVLGCPIVRTVSDQGPAYGAALLAGVAAGVYANVEKACAGIEIRAEACEPDPERARLYNDYHAVYRSLYPRTAVQMHALADLADPPARPD